MKQNGHENWQLAGVCDRKFAYARDNPAGRSNKAFTQAEIIDAAREWIRAHYPDSTDDTRFQRLGLLIDFVTDLVPSDPDHFPDARKMVMPRPTELAAVPLLGFRAAWAAVWSQSQKVGFALQNLATISASVIASGVILRGTIRREQLSRWLCDYPCFEGDYHIPTVIGILYVKPFGQEDSWAEVSVRIDHTKDVTDEGWIKGFDRACDEIWRKNALAVPTASTGRSKHE